MILSIQMYIGLPRVTYQYITFQSPTVITCLDTLDPKIMPIEQRAMRKHEAVVGTAGGKSGDPDSNSAT